MRRPLVFASLCLLAAPVLAQQSITQTPGNRPQWALTAGGMSYILGVNDVGMVQTLYWGQKLAPGATLPPAKEHPERASFDGPLMTTPLEYPAFGAGLHAEPALKLDSPNGDRTLVLVYKDAKTSSDTLDITLADKVQPIQVHLLYRVFAQQGIIARSSRIEILGKAPAVIEQAASATWNLPAATNYQWSWLTGQWGGEWQLHTAALHPGTQLIESRRGSTGHQANPWFAISRAAPAPDQTTETSGPVWFGELGWSGSWRLTVEQTGLNHLRITGGYNPFDFAYTLRPGESLETPPFYAGYTSHGQGEASRILHRFQLAQILPTHPHPKPRPIIYNSWEATTFSVDEPGQISLAEKAAAMGIERFVMDDGWFGARNTDHAGLGDWYVNKTKFPNGLKPLIDRVHSLGMDFGLWVEPEMVNPDSDLYRKHPNWAMNFPVRQRTEQRNQLLLNLARPDVRDYVFNFLDKLVSENDIAFLKWDYNRNWSEPGWDTAPGSSAAHPHPTAEKEIYVRYVQNLYDILKRLREKHPRLEIESCSGGGGRVDLGILRYTDEVWPSDNTDALDRLLIQDGFTHAYTPETMVAWVTDVPNFNGRSTPLQFRFLVAMGGALGVGSNLNKMSPAELAEAKDLVAFYKQVRSTVQHGSLYRLMPPRNSETSALSESSAVQYVSTDGAQSLVLAYLQSQHFGLAYPTLRLEGLDPNATYRIRPYTPSKSTAAAGPYEGSDRKRPTGPYSGPNVVSGSVLMGQGLDLNLRGDLDSAALILDRVTTP